MINEYAWLWLNRDGTPTTLTDTIYKYLFPEAVSADRRFDIYARYLAMLTEYWRSSRKSAAVMHFCGLGYSRSEAPRGQTSDNFTDIKNLVFEPHFYNAMKSAFNPVGLMVEMWENHFTPGTEITVPVHICNDRPENWEGIFPCSFPKGIPLSGPGPFRQAYPENDLQTYKMKVTMPENKAFFKFTAEIKDHGESVQSIREFELR